MKPYFEEDNCNQQCDDLEDLEQILLESGLEYLTGFSQNISEFE
jgi:hypothetical protein